MGGRADYLRAQAGLPPLGISPGADGAPTESPGPAPAMPSPFGQYDPQNPWQRLLRGEISPSDMPPALAALATARPSQALGRARASVGPPPPPPGAAYMGQPDSTGSYSGTGPNGEFLHVTPGDTPGHFTAMGPNGLTYIRPGGQTGQYTATGPEGLTQYQLDESGGGYTATGPNGITRYSSDGTGGWTKMQ